MIGSFRQLLEFLVPCCLDLLGVAICNFSVQMFPQLLSLVEQLQGISNYGIFFFSEKKSSAAKVLFIFCIVYKAHISIDYNPHQFTLGKSADSSVLQRTIYA